MPTLHIPMGIPGCGKSTWGERFGIPTVSSDAIRAEMGDVYDQSRNEEVFAEFHARIADHLMRGNDVYADATNLSAQARSNLRSVARVAARDLLARYGTATYETDGVVTHVILFRNLAEAIIRNQRRERVVPPEAMVRMIEKYERAVLDIGSEGYTYITEVSAVR
jgi:predicted kinase